ncbi:MAG TPA: hypothetical protein VMH34_00220 [Gammaproteobacteria bacterium]|nr:hypothetical protein [Gammaproteobacteria bacterium]
MNRINITLKIKDLAQARELTAVFQKTDSTHLEDTLSEVCRRGPKWKKNVLASLREIKQNELVDRLSAPHGRRLVKKRGGVHK